jgi:hypothetical protein
MPKITDYPALTSPASNDVLLAVDVDDTTETPAGSTKQLAISQLPSGGAPLNGDGGSILGLSDTSAGGVAGSTGQAADAGHQHPAETTNNTLDDGLGNAFFHGNVFAQNMLITPRNTLDDGGGGLVVGRATINTVFVLGAQMLFVSGNDVFWDATNGSVLDLTLTASGWTFQPSSNQVNDQEITLRLTQGGLGGHTITWNTDPQGFNFGVAGAPTLSTGAGAIDILKFMYVNAKQAWCCTSAALGF